MFAGEFARKQYWQKLSEYSNFFKKKKISRSPDTLRSPTFVKQILRAAGCVA